MNLFHWFLYRLQTFLVLACIRLTEIVEKYGLDWNIASYEEESQTLLHFLIQLANEERR